MKHGPGESYHHVWYKVVVDVEGVALSRWRKRKGKEEMAGQSPGLSFQVKGGREGTTPCRGEWTTSNYHNSQPVDTTTTTRGIFNYIIFGSHLPCPIILARYKTSFYTTFNFMTCSHAFTIITSVSVVTVV